MGTSGRVELPLKDRAFIVLAGIGLYNIGAGVLHVIYRTLGAYVIIRLPVPSTDVLLVLFGLLFPCFALLPASGLIGWLLPRRGWLYGLIAGICAHAAGTVVSSISVIQAIVALRQNPADAVYSGLGSPYSGVAGTWLASIVIPPTLAMGLGAIGGFCGQRWRHRLEHQGRGDT